MAKKKKDENPEQSYARFEVTEQDKAKARKWFDRAKQLADDKNFDYAVEGYLRGLEFWPEAVDEAHQPLRLAASERSIRGGKKPGFADTMKLSMTGKDAKKAMLNAEQLLSLDPRNLNYVEGLMRNANKLHCEDVLLWITPIYRNSLDNEKKLNPKRYQLLREVCEEAGDRASQRKEDKLSAQFYEMAADAIQAQKLANPKDLSLDNELRDLSTKLTILKGKYESAESFQESMRDADDQKAIHDKDRMITDDDDLAKLIKRAEDDLAQNPDNPGKVETLVDLLCRGERSEGENRAITLLVEKFKTYDEYRFKALAEDIKAKQVRRAIRQAKAKKDVQQAKKLTRQLLKFELDMFTERAKQYPTDNSLKYEVARRLFESGRYDDAIPHFQAARANAKVRFRADLALGRCFYEKKFYAQATGTLTQAISTYETQDDTIAKDLRYWLARSHEDDGKIDDAKRIYGEILQLDYNYRDVRQRLEDLTS
jgi:tetratricopeptide (TPR) repeat protein